MPDSSGPASGRRVVRVPSRRGTLPRCSRRPAVFLGLALQRTEVPLARVLVGGGFAFLALSSVWLSKLTFDVAWSNIAFVTFLNGLANPLIFIALSTMSFGTLRRDQMGGATGIYNLMRNLGGGIGTRLFLQPQREVFRLP